MTKRVVLEQHHWTAEDLDHIKDLLDCELFEQADQALQFYLNDYPDDMRGLFLLGRLRIIQERYADARCIYDWLLDKYGERVGAEIQSVMRGMFSKLSPFLHENF